MRPKAIVCDDEAHIRSLLRLILKNMGVEVVGEAGTVDEAENLFQTLKPHMVLLDVNLRGGSGEDVLAKIIQESPSAFVIMLTAVSDAATVQRCLSLGAANYILKEIPTTEIMTIIKETWEEFKKTKSAAEARETPEAS